MKKRKDGLFEKVVTINGKKKHFYSKAPTEKQAEKDFDRQLLNYKEKEEKGKLLLEVSDEWLSTKEKTLAYSTYTRYVRYTNQLCGYFPNRHIKDITADELEYTMQDMSEKQYSTKTITDYHSVFCAIFKYAKRKMYIKENVAEDTEVIKGQPPIERTPLADDIKVSDLLKYTFGTLVYFLIYTGLRKGEALALQWKDIDFENKIIHITKSVYFVSNKPYIKTPKTKSGIRDVILLDNLAGVLKPLKKKPDDYVFNKDGKLLGKSYFTRQWEKFKKESGIDITAHPLRHTYATMLFEMGINEKDAQELMGHSSIQVTHNVYTHIRQKHKDALAEKMNNYIKSIEE